MNNRVIRAVLAVPFLLALLEASSGTLVGLDLAAGSVLGALAARDLFRAGGVL